MLPNGKRDLTSGSLKWNLFRLAAPAAAGIILQSAYNLVDAFWLGKVGSVALNAPGLTGQISFLVVAAAFGFSVGGTALVAQYTGAGRHSDADRAAAQNILLLCFLITLLSLPTIVLTPWVLKVCQAPPESVPAATAYMRIYMSGMPLVAFVTAYAGALRALGDTITVVIITAAANVLNFGLDPVLIFGLAGMPRLGVTGAALATIISQAIAALVCLGCLLRGRAGLRIGWRDLRPDWDMLGRTLRIGFPSALAGGLNSFAYNLFTVFTINPLGSTTLSAFTIGFRVIHFFDAPTQAMAAATGPVVGQALGAGKVKLARRAVWLSVLVVGLLMAPLVILLAWQGQFVARLFIPDPEVIAETRRFFFLVPSSTYLFGVLMVLMAAFYGSGHTVPALVVAITRGVVRVGIAVLLVYVAGAGSIGAYIGMVAGNVVAALLALWLFLAGGWETGVIRRREGAHVPPEGPGAAAGSQRDRPPE